MAFLILVLAVALSHQLGALTGVHRDAWFAQWRNMLQKQPPLQKYQALTHLLSIMVPVTIVAVVLWLMDDHLWGLSSALVSFFILLYGFGRGDINSSVENYQQALGRDDFQAAYHDAARFNIDRRESNAENWRDLHDQTLSAVAYCYFERYFPTLFWFVVLGAPGALLYRLTALGRNVAVEQDGSRDVIRLLWLLEWVPARLLGLLFAVVGDFGAAISCWKNSAADLGSDTTQVVFCSVSGTLRLQTVDPIQFEGGGKGAAEMQEVIALFDRSLILALAVAALLAILL